MATVGEVLRRNQGYIDKALVKLQLVVRHNQCGVHLVALAGDGEVNLHDVSLVVLHFRWRANALAELIFEAYRKSSMNL